MYKFLHFCDSSCKITTRDVLFIYLSQSIRLSPRADLASSARRGAGFLWGGA